MSFQMDLDVKGFGRGPQELGGATDLVKQYRLWPYHEFFCKRSLPLSETHYLQNVVGDTQIRKGEGMEFDQLLEKTAYMRERNANIHPIDFGMLSEAFRIKETTPVHLPSAEKGILTSVVKSKGELEDKERKHKKNKNKDKDRKKHKKRRLDNSGDVDKTYENVTNGSKTVQLKEQPDMFIQKKRLNGPEDLSDRDNKRLPKSFHFSGNGGGVLHGTCEAIVCTMAAARDQMLSRIGSDNLGKLVVYGSDQTHSILQKATQIVGIKPENFRVIKTTKSVEFALSPEMLRLTVCSDLDKGLVPLFLCATIGTTSTTAIDQLEALCDVAKEYGIWVHVDGAYVGSAFRHSIDGVEGANSFSFNPHKWLFTAMDCCCLWVKNPSALIRSLSTNPEYLRNKASDSKQVVDYKDWQIALSRRFWALKMWLVLRSYGVANLRSFIRSHVKMAKIFEGLVRMDNRFEIVVPRNYSLVCFRISPSAIVSDDHSYNGEEYTMVNEINCKLLEAISASGSVFMTHAVVGGVYLLRCTAVATLTEEKHIVEAWKVVQGQAHAILSACVVDLHNPMRYPNI